MTSNTQSPILSAPGENSVSPAMKQENRIQQTQIVRLITGSGFSNIAGIAMAIIWVGIIWKNLPHEVLTVWLSM